MDYLGWGLSITGVAPAQAPVPRDGSGAWRLWVCVGAGLVDLCGFQQCGWPGFFQGGARVLISQWVLVSAL